MQFTLDIKPSEFTELSNAVMGLIEGPIGTRSVRKGVVASLRIIGKEQAARAPVSQGRTKNKRPWDPSSGKVVYPGRTLKRSIGKPVFSRGTGKRISQQRVVAKVGANTGRKLTDPDAGGAGFAHHAHLVALGTRRRTTGEVKGKPTGGPYLNRGTMPANPFIAQATDAKAAEALDVLEKTILADIEKAWAGKK